MRIKTSCSKCGKNYTVPNEYLGKKVSCKACGHVFRVQARVAEEPVPMLTDDMIMESSPAPPLPPQQSWQTHQTAGFPPQNRFKDARHPVQSAQSERQYAGFWIRVWAYLIDSVVLLFPISLLDFLITNTANNEEAELTAAFAGLLIWVVYTAVCHSSEWQATVGKKVLGLIVIDENGHRISFGRATGRFFAEFINAIILGIGWMMIGWTSKKQGLHDMMAGTYVVKSGISVQSENTTMRQNPKENQQITKPPGPKNHPSGRKQTWVWQAAHWQPPTEKFNFLDNRTWPIWGKVLVLVGAILAGLVSLFRLLS